MKGKYYSEFFITSAGSDLLDQVRTNLGVDRLTVDKMTFVTSSNLHIDINDIGIYSSLYPDPDAIYKLSLDSNDINVSVIRTQEGSMTVFLAIVYR
jgi:hypothetical protein